jgi:hypothetical protein
VTIPEAYAPPPNIARASKECAIPLPRKGGVPRGHRYENNIKIDIEKIVFLGVDRIHLARDKEVIKHGTSGGLLWTR